MSVPVMNFDLLPAGPAPSRAATAAPAEDKAETGKTFQAQLAEETPPTKKAEKKVARTSEEKTAEQNPAAQRDTNTEEAFETLVALESDEKAPDVELILTEDVPTQAKPAAAEQVSDGDVETTIKAPVDSEIVVQDETIVEPRVETSKPTTPTIKEQSAPAVTELDAQQTVSKREEGAPVALEADNIAQDTQPASTVKDATKEEASTPKVDSEEQQVSDAAEDNVEPPVADTAKPAETGAPVEETTVVAELAPVQARAETPAPTAAPLELPITPQAATQKPAETLRAQATVETAEASSDEPQEPALAPDRESDLLSEDGEDFAQNTPDKQPGNKPTEGMTSPNDAKVFAAAETGQTQGDPQKLALNTQSIAPAPSPTNAPAAQMAKLPEVLVQVPQERADLAAKTVGVEIAKQAKQGETQFVVRMDPPELGKLEVRLKVAPTGEVQAQIIADRSDTLDLLNRDSKALERALTDSGLKADQDALNFSLRQETQGDGDAQGTGFAQNGSEGDGSEDDIIIDAATLAFEQLRAGRPLDVTV